MLSDSSKHRLATRLVPLQHSLEPAEAVDEGTRHLNDALGHEVEQTVLARLVARLRPRPRGERRRSAGSRPPDANGPSTRASAAVTERKAQRSGKDRAISLVHIFASDGSRNTSVAAPGSRCAVSIAASRHLFRFSTAHRRPTFCADTSQADSCAAARRETEAGFRERSAGPASRRKKSLVGNENGAQATCFGKQHGRS